MCKSFGKLRGPRRPPGPGHKPLPLSFWLWILVRFGGRTPANPRITKQKWPFWWGPVGFCWGPTPFFTLCCFRKANLRRLRPGFAGSVGPVCFLSFYMKKNKIEKKEKIKLHMCKSFEKTRGSRGPRPPAPGSFHFPSDFGYWSI